MHEPEHITVNILNPTDTFFVGDFHFDHTNIIEYANRPFKSTEEMNLTMLNNYNNAVNDSSLVFFLGDMAFGKDSKKPRWWLSQLKGNIIYIKGSHDNGIRPTSIGLNALRVCDLCEFKFERIEFLLTHIPVSVKNYGGWNIHAHTHDHDQKNLDKRKFCVSVEAINYTPISLIKIIEEIHGSSN